MGHYVIYGFKFESFVEKSNFEGFLTSVVGYFMFAIGLILLYGILAITSFNRARRIIGLCYIVIKVGLLIVIEIVVFPLICGVWLDLCTLKLLNATINDRIHNYNLTSGTSVFIHWLIGMVYVFYFATFVFLLREILRPGVLWFLRNLNDPDFNPIQEMIRLSVFRHIKRFMTSVILFGFSVVLVFLLPIKLISWLSPSIFPYNVSSSSETLASELSIELLWLHVILPALLEQNHMKLWIKNCVYLWTLSVARLLDLRSYLLGDDTNIRTVVAQVQQDQQQQQEQQNNLFPFNIGVAHQALLQSSARSTNLPYTRPKYFKIRIALLIIIICASLFACSLATLVVPVSLGRWLLLLITGKQNLHELYTIFAGLYTIWLFIRLGTLVSNWIQIGLRELSVRFKQKLTLIGKAMSAVFLIFGIIPLLFGLLFQLIVIVPISCGYEQTPVISAWQTWALGVLLTKIFTACVLSGPTWWLKQAIERVCQDGLRQIDLKFIAFNLFLPVAQTLAYCLTLPCVLVKSFIPLFISNVNLLTKIERRIYPLSLFLLSFILLTVFQFKQFKRLYEKIRKEK
jgi:E3 ubiquitin-protein ligase MARCH6